MTKEEDVDAMEDSDADLKFKVSISKGRSSVDIDLKFGESDRNSAFSLISDFVRSILK